MTHFDYSAHCTCRECRSFTLREIRDALLVGVGLAVVVLVAFGMTP